jgi:class 3 adenylate cyclase/tetratricopeptide (TPR) repeat protein
MAEPDVICSNCNQPNPQRAKFCLECGAPLTAGVVTAGREERKVVSVLFADLVGFTSRAEHLDPEEVRAILAPYHARLRAELERYGGTVEKFIGDAVMALFGAPITHEDDPERAVRASLAIRDGLTEDGRLHVRIGITTGEALVALDARPESGEGMASGDVVNSAARLQTSAPVDGILVDDATYRATSRVINYDEHPPVAVKGKSDPVVVHQAVSVNARVGTDVRQVGGPALVGRTSELQLLEGALERATTGRQPQLVTLVGVPGIGKSRLVWELFQQVDRAEDLVAWRQGRSLPYAESISYWALGEIVKAEAGILETDGEHEARAKVGQSVGALVDSAQDADWIARHLAMLVGAESGAELRGDRRGEAFAAWRRYLEALADRRPTVLVFEDLHWADDGLLDFIDGLVEWIADVPLLVVGTSRPELLARRQGWGGGKTNAITISLAPLSDAETRTLVASLVEQALVPVALSETVLERAQGNPLYAEEFARLMAERGGIDDLPESVQGIIAARIDGLTRDEKELLQDAAVVGKVFWSGALMAMRDATRAQIEERLHALERREFVRRDRRSSLADETEYSFRHILVRDVAYGQIPRGERAARHFRVAAWLENLGRPAEHAELLAGHYVAALELARAAGQSIDDYAARARETLLHAGERALELSSFTSAARHFRAALDLMAPDDAARPMALFGYGKALRVSEEKGADVLAEAEELLLAEGLREPAAEAAMLQAELAWFGGDGDSTIEHVRRATRMVDGLPSSFAKAFVLSDASRFHMLRAEPAEAISIGERALVIADELGLHDIRAHALNNIGIARSEAGDPTGLGHLERAIEIATEIRSREVARAWINTAAAQWRMGDMRRAGEATLAALDAAREFGDASTVRFARMSLPDIYYGRGEWDEALALLDELIAESEAAGGHVLESAMRTTRSRIRLARGDAEGALADGVSSLEAGRRARDPQAHVPPLSHMVWLQHEVGGPGSEVDALINELVAAPAAEAYVSNDALLVMLLGERRREAEELVSRMKPGWVRTVAEKTADGQLVEAAEILANVEDLPLAAVFQLEAARQMLADGRPTEAEPLLEASDRFWHRTGGSYFLEQAAGLRSGVAHKDLSIGAAKH